MWRSDFLCTPRLGMCAKKREDKCGSKRFWCEGLIRCINRPASDFRPNHFFPSQIESRSCVAAWKLYNHLAIKKNQRPHKRSHKYMI